MDVKGGVHNLRELAEVGILCVHRPSSEDSLQKVGEFCKSPRLVRENEITITTNTTMTTTIFTITTTTGVNIPMVITTSGDFLTKMKRAGTGLGFYMIDKEIAAYTKKWIEDTKTENFITEEDVTKILKTGGDNKTTVFMEKYWM